MTIYIGGATDEELKILKLRGEFAKKYCTKKGWDIDNLSLEQLLEIRSRPEWEKPLTNQESTLATILAHAIKDHLIYPSPSWLESLNLNNEYLEKSEI